MSVMYADIVVDIALKQLDRCFTYIVPPEYRDDIREGFLVSVPFGGGNRYVKGYVIRLTDTTDAPLDKLKYIDELLIDESTVDSDLLAVAIKMKERYGGTLSQSLKVVFPVKKKINPKKKEVLVLTEDSKLINERLLFYKNKGQAARLRLLSELIIEKVIPKEIATTKLNVNSTVIKALLEHGVISIEEENNNRSEKSEKPVLLNNEQQAVVDDFIKDYEEGKINNYLVHGVTGSGKTEVYIEIIDYLVKQGKQAIVLIPEISLSYQTLMRFYKRFNSRVRAIHSKLSEGERYQVFSQARAGEIDVVIGPRSALFTPFANLGIIVMDEEHDGSYKSEKTPKYHAREIAKIRARLSNIPFIMGSATPSIDTYYQAKNGLIKLCKLNNRALGADLPNVSIVDLKEELRAGNKLVFSRILLDKISERLKNNEQAVLFINRRGYAGFISCRSCGYVYKCPHCDVSMTLHGKKELVCHYCGHTEPYSGICPECGSKYIGTMKSGTEAVADSLSEIFPDAKILRMDYDTVSKKGAYEEILTTFENHEADIMIGTQMIVKGHDFPDVTLVGILLADISLYASDYMASERTFALLTQCSGRAGRREKHGEVVIQSYSPDNETILLASKQDYEAFYESEISYRELMNYPPVGHMLVILFEDMNEVKLGSFCERIGKIINNSLYRFEDSISVVGPAPANVAYINDIFRKVIYVKALKYESLIEIKDALERFALNEADGGKKNPSMQFDFDPMDGY